MSTLDEILAEDEKETQVPASTNTETDEEAKKKAQLDNLNRAIAEANAELKAKRQAIKEDRTDDDLPKIDLDDPSAQAWDKHIKNSVSPMQAELEKEKEEVFTYSIKEFLSDKPSLASNPEKLKQFVGMYEKIKDNSGRTKEGVLLDLGKAFGALYGEQLINAVRNQEVSQAKADAIFSDIAVNRGATSYASDKSSPVKLSEDDKKILQKWGMSPEEWQEDKKNHG